MGLPNPGAYFEGGYVGDDGASYRLGYTQGFYAADQGVLPPAALPVLPWFAVPRHLVCQFTDGANIALVRVVCPIPFSQVSDPNRTTLITSDGFTLEVTGRVGENYMPFDQQV